MGASTLEEFVGKLEKPRTAWVMLPAGKITEATIEPITMHGITRTGSAAAKGIAPSVMPIMPIASPAMPASCSS